MKRAYSILEVKSIDDDQRVITGLATTPSTDRMDDIVMPRGGVLKLPLPLLWQHDSSQPVGQVTAAKVSDAGILVTCQFAQVDEPPSLKDDLDRAWSMVKAKLVRGFSIGFNPIESADIEGSWGRRFTKWEMLELSCVTIPANADCSIQTIKSIDLQQLAASGHKPPAAERREPPPGASGTTKTNGPSRAVSISRKDTPVRKTITQQIQDLESTLAAKAARMNELNDAAAEQDRTLDDSEAEEFTTLSTEIKTINQDIARKRELETLNASTAKAVDGSSSAAASASRAGFATVKTIEKLAPGIQFARFAMCLGAAKGDLATASRIGQARFPHDERINHALKHAADTGSSMNLLTKASVDAATTTDATWAAPLVEYNQFAGDFVEYLRPQTILGKLGVGGIPGLRRIPFNVHVRGQTSGGAGYWVGQGAAKPVTKFDYNDAYLGYTKVANIAVLTEEIMRFSNPAAEGLVRDALAAALIERMDIDFIDPDKAEVANVSPASITNGVTPIASSGTDADHVRADIAALWATAIGTNLPATSAVYITDPQTALRLSLMRNPLGQKEFPDITMMGGSLDGVPLVVSNYAINNSTGNMFILAFVSEIWLADDGQVTIDVSREASIQMLDNPTNNSATATATAMVSMFQTDSVALRAHRFINWKKRRNQAVAYIADQAWGT